MPDDSPPPSIERQQLADWVRGARLHAPKGESDEFYRGWDAGLRRLMLDLFLEGSLELHSFDTLPPSKDSMNRKPRAR